MNIETSKIIETLFQLAIIAFGLVVIFGSVGAVIYVIIKWIEKR